MYTEEIYTEYDHSIGAYKQLGRGAVCQNITVLYPIYYAGDDMFRSLWAIFRSQKCIERKSIQSMIVVKLRILNFQRDLVDGWIIHIELKYF